jgi:hypothetical protein
VLIVLCAQVSLRAQLSNNALNYGSGSSASGLTTGNRDRNGNPIDTTAVVDANTIPIGLYSWKIDSRFGDVTPVPVDTLTHAFQNSNDTGGMEGHYNYLGNMGSPRLSRLFFERRDASQAFFTDPYDFSVKRPQDLIFTNTLSPFTNVSYYKGGGTRYAEERFKSYFTINAGKKFGVGFYIDYLYGRGLYDSQSTAFFNGGLFASYRGEKYDMHFVFSNNNMKMAENGGITDDRYITNPLEMAEGKKTYSAADIPVTLGNIWNHNTGYHVFLTQRYNMGFTRNKAKKNAIQALDSLTANKLLPDSLAGGKLRADSLAGGKLLADKLSADSLKADSLSAAPQFVPVTSVIHTLDINTDMRKYISYDDAQNRKYFYHHYLGNDSIDKTRHFSVKNTLALALLEGFHKWAQAGLKAFASYDFQSYTLVDTLDGSKPRHWQTYNESTLSVGGELAKRQGHLLHYRALAEVGMVGAESGTLHLEGDLDLNFRFLGDTVRLDGKAFIKRERPVFYLRHFHGKHYWWDDDLEKITRTRIEGSLTFDRFGTKLTGGVENVKNYTYLANTSVAQTNSAGDVTGYLNDAAVRQCADNIQVLSLMWQQQLHAGIFHLDFDVAYQKSSNQQVLPLPDLNVYGNAYLRAGLAKKVLTVELGADVRYFSQYYAPDYSPAIGQFYNQNPEDQVKIGGYPIVNLYANLHLKRTRFFIQWYHFNAGSGNGMAFLAPHYPINPKMIKFGLSWNFFD